MNIEAGDRVRCYNTPTHVYVVEETDVDRDIEVGVAAHVWRLPDGNTLLRREGSEDDYLVAAERGLFPA